VATTNGVILIGGLAVAWMWWKKNNGAGFSPVMASTEMTGNPTKFSVGTIESANWIAQRNVATPPSTTSYTAVARENRGDGNLYTGIPSIGPSGYLSL
tara:strand:+ start:234 stop:527 length:294 start_codon:yes stop_codon:yes gene_type:complete